MYAVWQYCGSWFELVEAACCFNVDLVDWCGGGQNKVVNSSGQRIRKRVVLKYSTPSSDLWPRSLALFEKPIRIFLGKERYWGITGKQNNVNTNADSRFIGVTRPHGGG